MLRNLAIIHRKTPAPFPGVGMVWETCLRRILLGNSVTLSSVPLEAGDEVYREEKAYAFLLEVLCGLHSKVLGENEIVGQFKQRFLCSGGESAFHEEFPRLPQRLLADMKRVRAKFPLNLGNHSYGSYVRSALAGRPEKGPGKRLAILGTGALARSILPWVAASSSPVDVLYHSEKGRCAFQASFGSEMKLPADSVRLSPFSAAVPTGAEVLIVAASMTAEAVLRLLLSATEAGGSFPSLVFDFRGDCAADPLLIPSEVIDLHDFFRQTESVDEASAERAKKAKLLIDELSKTRLEAESIQIRTQGWEDLCS